MAERLAQVQALQEKVVTGVRLQAPSSRKKASFCRAKGVARLLDQGSSFLELSALAGLGMHDDDGKKVRARRRLHRGHRPGGRQARADFGQRQRRQGWHRGAHGPEKGLRAQAIALQNKLPLVSLVESGGANLMYQADIFCGRRAQLCQPGAPVGRRYSAIAVVHGSSTAGGAYRPACPTMWCWKDRSSIYLAGRPW